MSARNHGFTKEGAEEIMRMCLVYAIFLVIAGIVLIGTAIQVIVNGIAARQEYGLMMAFITIGLGLAMFAFSWYFYCGYREGKQNLKLLQEEEHQQLTTVDQK
jgi:membrane protease YdiL (CAAX protease family)